MGTLYISPAKGEGYLRKVKRSVKWVTCERKRHLPNTWGSWKMFSESLCGICMYHFGCGLPFSYGRILFEEYKACVWSLRLDFKQSFGDDCGMILLGKHLFDRLEATWMKLRKKFISTIYLSLWHPSPLRQGPGWAFWISCMLVTALLDYKFWVFGESRGSDSVIILITLLPACILLQVRRFKNGYPDPFQWVYIHHFWNYLTLF